MSFSKEYNNDIVRLVQYINQDILENSTSLTGKLTLKMGDVEIPLQSKDPIGGALQEWITQYAKSKNITITKNTKTQEFPDYFTGIQTHLEVKSFFTGGSPGFDICNFDTYSRSLLVTPRKFIC